MADIDAVAILDVPIFPHAEQGSPAGPYRDALGSSGVFITRVGMAGGWHFRFSQWVDRQMARLQGHPVAPTYCRPLAEWLQILQGFCRAGAADESWHSVCQCDADLPGDLMQALSMMPLPDQRLGRR